jgi:hypothetical protein
MLCLLPTRNLIEMLARPAVNGFFGGHRKDIRIGPLSQAHCGIARPDLVPSRVVSATEIRILEITARLT